MFGGLAWTRVTEADGRPGQWYLHLFDTGQPDWNWRNPDVPAFFEQVIRFWLDRGAAGLRVDVAHGIFKDPGLPDDPDPEHLYGPVNAPSAYHHRPELQQLYRSWRAILDSYPADGFPGARTAVGEVWADTPGTLLPVPRARRPAPGLQLRADPGQLGRGRVPRTRSTGCSRWPTARARRGSSATTTCPGR